MRLTDIWDIKPHVIKTTFLSDEANKKTTKKLEKSPDQSTLTQIYK